MEFILGIEYAFYLFSLCDARLVTPFLSQHSLLWRIYGIILIVQYIISLGFEMKKNNGKVHIPSIMIYMTMIVALTFFEVMNSHTDNNEWIVLIGFLITVFITGLEFGRYNSFFELLLLGFLVPNLVLVLNCVFNNIQVFDFLRDINFGTLFSNEYNSRVRFSLGFPNPNSIGNLSSTLIMIDIPLIIKSRKFEHVKALQLIFMILGIFDFLLLLESGSRTGLLALLFGLFLYMGYRTAGGKANETSAKNKVIHRILIFFIVAFCALFFLDRFVESYLISGRIWSVRLPSALNSIQLIFGIGIFNPGEVANITLNGLNLQGTIDNYYIYLLMTVGILGIVIYCLFFIKLFFQLRKGGSNLFIYSILACFFFDVIYGFGETCILYIQFPSSVIFVPLFICLGEMIEKGTFSLNEI